MSKRPSLTSVPVVEPTEQDLIRASDRARLQACAPEIKAVIASLTGKVVRDVIKSIDKGTFDPDYAYNAWLEYYAAYKMEKKLLVGVVKD